MPWEEKPAETLNVAVSHAGLRALGVRDELLASFPEEFRAGMAGRAGGVGATNDIAPGTRAEGARPGGPGARVAAGAPPDEGPAAAPARLRGRAAPPPPVDHR